MSRYAAQWRGESAEGCLERTLTPGECMWGWARDLGVRKKHEA